MKSSVTQASSAWDYGKEESLGRRHYQQSSAAWHAAGPPSPPTVQTERGLEEDFLGWSLGDFLLLALVLPKSSLANEMGTGHP